GPYSGKQVGDRMNIYQMLAYEGMRTFIGPWLELGFRIHSEGAENVPEDGGALLVCNHRSILDPLALMNEVERYIHFVAGSRGFVIPMIKTLYHMTGMVRLSLRGGQRGSKGLDKATQLMRDGEIVGIFPEGIESFMRPDKASRISYFRTGFARMALEAGVPIIPAAVIPQEEVKPPAIPGKIMGVSMDHPASGEGSLRFLLYRKVLVRIGKPIDLEGFMDEPLTKNAIDTLSGKLRRVVIKLYNGEDLDRFLTGKLPFDAYTDRV
ncbi:MAG: 1-acyl-sn-glycerol-3-phosphate acyltransferase, partial [Actinobacteria bacterium]|nr:1-acyl-sn-glycerol-3-phosphate acyltransferase [Actinomycetota bacterium]